MTKERLMAGAPDRAGDQRSAQVINLLNQLGDRIIRSEKERFSMRAEMAQTRDILEKIETRAERTERIFLTIQDRVEKQAAIESRILKRQDDLERLTHDNIARMQRAEALAARIEEAIILQNRLARRLERTTQDKARILSKIERIEASVEQARDIFGPLPEPRPSTIIPQPANSDKKQDGAKALGLLFGSRVALFVSMVAGGVLAGVIISQLALHWPQSTKTSSGYANTVKTASTSPAKGLPEALADISTQQEDLAPYGNGLTEKNVLESMENNPDAVAEMLNRIEPGLPAGSGAAADGVALNAAEQGAKKDLVSPQPVNFTPPDADGAEPASILEGPAVMPDPVPQAATGASVDLKKAEEDAARFVGSIMPAGQKLTDRIKPDGMLPPVIRKIEQKAFDGLPEAQHDLAAIYTAGHGGVEVNYNRAASWFTEAAINGVANARYNLGVLYHQGLGVERDIGKAINWYRAAAVLKHPEAQYNLGIAYIEGIGTQYDPRAATKFFQLAAQGGVMEAAYNLGLIHENGLLGDPDMNEALYWYKMASGHSPEARVAYDQMIKALTLSPDQIDRVVKEYSKIYGLDGEGRPVAGAAKKASAPVSPQHIQSATAVTVDAAPLSLSDIPPLDSEQSNKLIAATGEDHGLVAQVQEQLIRLGLYPGPADGISTPQMEDAIRSYQSSSNMKPNGKVTEELLVNMLASELNAVNNSLVTSP